MLPDQFNKLEIIESIQNDTTGETFKRTSEQLHQQRSVFKRELDAGVSKEEFNRLSMLIAAYDSALEVLPALWERAAADQQPNATP